MYYSYKIRVDACNIEYIYHEKDISQKEFEHLCVEAYTNLKNEDKYLNSLIPDISHRDIVEYLVNNHGFKTEKML